MVQGQVKSNDGVPCTPVRPPFQREVLVGLCHYQPKLEFGRPSVSYIIYSWFDLHEIIQAVKTGYSDDVTKKSNNIEVR